MNLLPSPLFLMPLLIGIFIVNVFFSVDNASLEQNAYNAEMSGDFIGTEGIYDELIASEPLNMHYHHEKIRSHFTIPKKITRNTYRDDDEIAQTYLLMSQSIDSDVSDIGHYALGYLAVKEENDFNGLLGYFKVKNRELPYLNSGIGYIYLENENYDLSERYFLKEIEIKGNVSGAYFYLAKLYHLSGQHEKLSQLILNDEASPFISERIIREKLLKNGKIVEYLTHVFSFPDATLFGFFGALLILIVWCCFLLWVDIYNSINIRFMFSLVFFSSIFSMFTHVLYDVSFFVFHLDLNRYDSHNVFASVLVSGFLETLLEIIPFLIFLKFTNAIKTSFDYIVYASASGLGAMFFESFMSFNENTLNEILRYSISITFLKMAIISFSVYGLMYGVFKGDKKYRYQYFSFAIFLSFLIRILFDFSVIFLPILSFVILFFVIRHYGRALTNALNYCSLNKKKAEIVKNSAFLSFSLSLIGTYQYMVIAYEFGVRNANFNLLYLFSFEFFMAIILITQLGLFYVIKGRWTSILKFRPKSNVMKL